MSLRAIDAIGIEALKRLISEGNPVEANFAGRFPIIEYWDALNCITRVLVVYEREADEAKAKALAQQRAVELLGDGDAPCGCIAMICGGDLEPQEVGDV